MNYRITAKNRKTNKLIKKLSSIIRFDVLNLNNYYKTLFIWGIIWIVSLFFDWFTNWDNSLQGNGFSKLLWVSWFLILITNIKILFLVLSKKLKDFLKKIFKVNIPDHILFIFLSVFSLCFSINSLIIINNLSVFDSHININYWIILNLVGSILSIIASLMNYYSTSKVWIIINRKWDEVDKIDIEKYLKVDEKNIKLPF